ncbi:DUF2637 domain-containing protein [Promicromonospora sp. CA-289599]|uniref:DUF2637 domain-containing protein n=1 Tax=Promicromonospora sp. CA-289599 TaxID=3240014 RepID=UPI003D91B9A6
MNRPTTARPAVRIAADSRPVLVFTVVLTVAVALASFALSFASLRDAALWGKVPESLAFLVPVVIDASVLVYGLVALVLRARGSSSAWAWTLMLGFTVVSIGANAAHAYDVGPELRTIVGVVLVALAPLSVLTSTHALASLVVAHTPVVEPEPVPVAEPITAAEPAPAAIESAAPVDVTPEPVPDPVPVPAELERSPVAAAPVARRPRLGRVRPVTQDALDLPGLVGADA